MATAIPPTLATTTATAAAAAVKPPFSPLQNSFHFPSKPLSPPLATLFLPLFKPRHHPHLSTSTTTQQLPSPPQQTALKPLLTLNPPTEFQDSSLFDVDYLLDLLKSSVKNHDFGLAKAVHASSCKLEENTYLGNALILAYIKLGLITDACNVFWCLSRPDVVSYSCLISCFAKANREIEAIELFFEMRRSGTYPNEYTFVAVLSACIRILDLDLGFQVHALAMKMGLLESVFVCNALMGLYAKCWCFNHLIQLFDEMPHRDATSWNTLLSSFVKELRYEAALDMFRELRENSGFRADQFTISTLLTACAGCHALMEGREVHGHAVRNGLGTNLSVNNAIIGFYTKCGSVKDGVAVFDRMIVRDVVTWTEMITAYMEIGSVDLAVEMFLKMPERNSVSYNAILSGFCRNNEGLKALDLFIIMVSEGIELTDFTLTSVVTACGLLMTLEISKQIHAFIIKFGLRKNACIEAALLDMYTRCRRMKDAEKIFHSWPSDEDSSIAWTSMLCGYARNGLPDHAILLFHRSLSEGTLVLDEIAVTSVLGVCGTLGFHEMGRQVHCHALKTGLVVDLGVGNSIVSMYSKCCNMNDAIKSFDVMPAHDIVSWNGLISVYLLYRQGDEALAVWSRMVMADLKPDSVTFALVLSAYKHTSSILVDECRHLFLSMKTVYNHEPTSEHYASLIGVLGYWGLLEEAEEMIINMPFEADASVWRALLDSCRTHMNTSIGKRVAKRILAMPPQDPSTFVLVSNLYSASGRWHCSEMVREDMREKGLRKHPCRSWIIHQKQVHSFYTRDNSHHQAKDIHSGLEILILECMKAGYEPDTSFVLHEVEEHHKKDFLFHHSAKLATAYALLMTRPEEPITIMKNILLCGDCHSFLKYVSAVTSREIVVRDTSGFHCFSYGQCSCKDHW